MALFEQGLGYTAVANRFGVSFWPVRSLEKRWRIRGQDVLVTKATKTPYSFEFKLDLVQRVLAGEVAADLAAEAGLSSVELLKTWVRQFRRKGEDALRPKPKGRPPGQVQMDDESELAKLRRENEYLRAKNAYLEKLKALREEGHR